MSVTRASRVVSLLALTVFTLVPAILAAAGILRQEPIDERRLAAARPSISASPFDEDVRAEWDAWWRDRFPLRSTVVKVEHAFASRFDNRAGLVLFGEDDFLFLPASVEPECYADERIMGWGVELNIAQAVAESAGVDLWFALAPDRATVIPEKLGIIDNSCQIANRSAIEQHLLSLPRTIDLAKFVTDARHVLRTDTHWSPEGALAAALGIVETLAPGSTEVVELATADSTRDGDLARQLGAGAEDVTNVEIMGPTVDSVEQIDTAGNSLRVITARTLAATDRHVFIIHDSFGGSGIIEGDPGPSAWGRGAARYMRPWFRVVVNLRIQARNADLIASEPAATPLRRADTIVALYVQRDLEYRFDRGKFVAPLVAGLLPDLDTEPVEGLVGDVDTTYPIPDSVAFVLDAIEPAAVEILVLNGEILHRTDGDDAVVLVTAPGTTISATNNHVGARVVMGDD
jgi:hypothetical protein